MTTVQLMTTYLSLYVSYSILGETSEKKFVFNWNKWEIKDLGASETFLLIQN